MLAAKAASKCASPGGGGSAGGDCTWAACQRQRGAHATPISRLLALSPSLTLHPLSSLLSSHPPRWDPYDVEELRGKTMGVRGARGTGPAHPPRWRPPRGAAAGEPPPPPSHLHVQGSTLLHPLPHAPPPPPVPDYWLWRHRAGHGAAGARVPHAGRRAAAARGAVRGGEGGGRAGAGSGRFLMGTRGRGGGLWLLWATRERALARDPCQPPSLDPPLPRRSPPSPTHFPPPHPPPPPPPAPPQDALYRPDQLAELMAASDYVVAATPWTPETDKIVSAAAIAAMKPNGVLVNVGRGKCVDEEALIEGGSRFVGGGGGGGRPGGGGGCSLWCRGRQGWAATSAPAALPAHGTLLTPQRPPPSLRSARSADGATHSRRRARRVCDRAAAAQLAAVVPPQRVHVPALRRPHQGVPVRIGRAVCGQRGPLHGRPRAARGVRQARGVLRRRRPPPRAAPAAAAPTRAGPSAACLPPACKHEAGPFCSRGAFMQGGLRSAFFQQCVLPKLSWGLGGRGQPPRLASAAAPPQPVGHAPVSGRRPAAAARGHAVGGTDGGAGSMGPRRAPGRMPPEWQCQCMGGRGSAAPAPAR
jgi:hypothetical protein